MRTIKSTLIGIGAAVVLCCVLGPAVNAQDTNAQDRGLVAICPAVFDSGAGTPEAQAEAIHAMRSKLEHAGFTVADYDSMKTKWKDLNIAMPVAGQPPTTGDLTRFGQAVGAKYVLEPEFDFSANKNWNVGGKYTTVKAAMKIFKASDGSHVYNQSETVSKSPKSSDDFATLSLADREQRVVDQAVEVSLARFMRRTKLTLQ
jgi:hypothetical protein